MLINCIIFNINISIEWEDPANRFGCDLSTCKAIYINDIDKLWENLVFGTIGELLEEHDEICGVRVVEKSKKGSRSFFRLELWMRNTNLEIIDRVKFRLTDVLSNSNVRGKSSFPEFDVKFRDKKK